MATSESGKFRNPPPLEMNSETYSRITSDGKGKWRSYLAASGASAKDDKVQTVIILNCAGPQVVKVMITLFGKMLRINTSPIKSWKP